MSEMIRISPLENRAEKPKPEIEELKVFPENIHILFEQLPDPVKSRIFMKTSKHKAEGFLDEDNRDLDRIVGSFDKKTREDFMMRCIDELFSHGKFKDRLEAGGVDNVKNEIERLLDLLWQNRGEHNNPVLFNQEYYENFFQNRKILLDKISQKKLEIKKLNASMVITRKQKRATEKKYDELHVIQKDVNVLTSELEKYDFEHGNTNYDHTYFRDVASRQQKEREWTKATIITCEYLQPTEFGILMLEQLNGTFFAEVSIASDKDPEPKWRGRILEERIVTRAKKITSSILEAMENWHAHHEEDEIFKKPYEAKSEEKQVKLIEYLISLMESYRRGRDLKKTDEEMIYTVRQMEIALNILGK